MLAHTFLYHEVCDSPEESGIQRKSALPYKHTIDHFRSDLKLISKHHSYSSLCNYRSLKVLIPLLMTFDDGGKSAMKSAEILEEQNWKGHFFIITSLINTPGFLSSSDIFALFRRGHIIGSHSHSHTCPFRSLSHKEQFEEWKISKNILEDILNKEITTASVPGGDMDNSTIISAHKAGIKHLFTSEPGLEIKNYKDMLIYGRFCPKNSTSAEVINRWAQGKGIKRIKIIRSLKDIIKRTFPFNIYFSRFLSKDLTNEK